MYARLSSIRWNSSLKHTYLLQFIYYLLNIHLYFCWIDFKSCTNYFSKLYTWFVYFSSLSLPHFTIHTSTISQIPRCKYNKREIKLKAQTFVYCHPKTRSIVFVFHIVLHIVHSAVFVKQLNTTVKVNFRLCDYHNYASLRQAESRAHVSDFIDVNILVNYIYICIKS